MSNKYLLLRFEEFFLKFEFPLAHFLTCGVTGDTLFPIVLEAVRVVESTGLEAIAITADGASPNQKFFRMHKSKGKIVYKTKNIYANDNCNIYFISDPQHLIKTI